MKKIVSLLVVILFILLITACSNKDIEKSQKTEEQILNQQQTEKKEIAKEEISKEEEVKEGIFQGDKAYDFTLLDREGNEVSLSSFKGKVVFLNFWASWCPPCRAEMPDIQKIYEKYKDTDVAIITVNLTAAEKNGIEDTNKFIDENDYTFPVLLDKDGEVAVKYRISGIPTTYIINKDGIIYNFITGAMNEEMMIEQIEGALK